MNLIHRRILATVAVPAALLVAPSIAHADCPSTTDGVALASYQPDGNDALEVTESIRFADVDGDGADDLCYASGSWVYCQTHKSYTCDTSQNPYLCYFTPEDDPDCGFGNHEVRIFFPFSVTSNISYAKSLSFVDLDDDDDLDVCARGANGIYCAENFLENGVPIDGLFESGSVNVPDATLWDSGFKDVHGWSQPQYGDTVTFVDIDQDGRTDVCGRGSAGIYCGFSNGSGFTSGGLLTENSDFGNSDIVHAVPAFGVPVNSNFNWGASPSYYGTIDFVDVNGDTYLDVCGRSANGVYCAEFNVWFDRFDLKRRYVDDQYLDVHGWAQEKYGTTVQFGDINGDGDMDVCGRGSGHVYCGLGDPSQHEFVGADQPAGYGVFTNAQGYDVDNRYETLMFADANGDGAADLCGRGADGYYCVFGLNGTLFPYLSGLNRILNNYGDNYGWNSKEQFWGSVQPANVNKHSGSHEFCGVGSAGVYCSD